MKAWNAGSFFRAFLQCPTAICSWKGWSLLYRLSHYLESFVEFALGFWGLWGMLHTMSLDWSRFFSSSSIYHQEQGAVLNPAPLRSVTTICQAEKLDLTWHVIFKASIYFFSPSRRSKKTASLNLLSFGKEFYIDQNKHNSCKYKISACSAYPSWACFFYE